MSEKSDKEILLFQSYSPLSSKNIEYLKEEKWKNIKNTSLWVKPVSHKEMLMDLDLLQTKTSNSKEKYIIKLNSNFFSHFQHNNYELEFCENLLL